MNKNFVIALMSISFLLSLSIVSAVPDYQYGMMDSNGQFYKYGMMGNDNQFYPSNSGYSGIMGYGGGMMGMMQMMGGYGGYGGGMMLLAWITYLLFIALIIAAIYWLIKSASKKK